jgi:hypothetical protein
MLYQACPRAEMLSSGTQGRREDIVRLTVLGRGGKEFGEMLYSVSDGTIITNL